MSVLRIVRAALWIAVAGALVSVSGVALGVWSLPAPERTRTVTGLAEIGGPFRLTSHRGETVSETDIRGKPNVLFFGFTHCPDICPTTLSELTRLLEQLGPGGDKARTLFVAFDPERDTQAALADYRTSFDPRIVALRGGRAQAGDIAGRSGPP